MIFIERNYSTSMNQRHKKKNNADRPLPLMTITCAVIHISIIIFYLFMLNVYRPMLSLIAIFLHQTSGLHVLLSFHLINGWGLLINSENKWVLFIQKAFKCTDQVVHRRVLQFYYRHLMLIVSKTKIDFKNYHYKFFKHCTV